MPLEYYYKYDGTTSASASTNYYYNDILDVWETESTSTDASTTRTYNLTEVSDDTYEFVPSDLEIEINYEHLLSLDYHFKEEFDVEQWRNKMKSFEYNNLKGDYKHINFMRKNRNRHKR